MSYLLLPFYISTFIFLLNNELQKKKVVVLGSTGSIGESTLKVANDLSDRMEIIGIAACSSVEKILSQLNETGASHACLTDLESAKRASTEIDDGVNFYEGEEGLIELATLEEADIVLIAIVGVAGLKPALAALRLEKTSPLQVKRS